MTDEIETVKDTATKESVEGLLAQIVADNAALREQLSAGRDNPSGEVEGMLTKIMEDQAAHRAEVASLRQELSAKHATAAARAPAVVQTPEERLESRMQEIEKFSHYCPGCGKLYQYMRECTGPNPAQPHPAMDVVSTDELKSDDTTRHTAAPATA